MHIAAIMSTQRVQTFGKKKTATAVAQTQVRSTSKMKLPHENVRNGTGLLLEIVVARMEA